MGLQSKRHPLTLSNNIEFHFNIRWIQGADLGYLIAFHMNTEPLIIMDSDQLF